MIATSKGYPNTPIPPDIEALAAEVERDPTDLVAKITLANALEQAGEVSKAVTLYQEVVALDGEGIYGSVSQKALENLDSKPLPESAQLKNGGSSYSEPSKELQTQPSIAYSSPSLLQRLRQGWENLNLRTKLTILLVGSAALPVIVVTQGIVAVTKERLSLIFKESVQKEATVFVEEYVLWDVEESKSEANTIAQLVQTIKIDLSNPRQVARERDLLQTYIGNFKVAQGSGSIDKNIRILTDAQGRTVAQKIQSLAEDSFNYPPDKLGVNARYRPVSLPLGIYLGDIPIVKNALSSGKPLSGMELLNSEVLKRLGQDKQAYIGLRPQLTQGVPESEQPFPKGTYDIDGGRAALAGMVVYPIKIGNKLVGTVIVGSLMNRTPVVVDSLKERQNVPFSTVFAQDWRVSSNVPYTDGQTRDIGTRAARNVAETVLNQGQEFIGLTMIAGANYLAVYQPLYDHQKELNPTGAKPVGMAFVGRPLAESESLLAKQQVIAYGTGGGMLLLAGLVAIPVAGSLARPLRRLTHFSQQVATGEQGVRLEPTSRGDEIGVLSRQLNAMTASIEANLEALRHQEAQQRQAKERLQKGMINLLLDIEGANQGDLTVRAAVKEGEMGSVADAFNTVISSLRQIVLQVKNAANLVHESAFESEASVQKLSDEATNQAKVVAEAQNSVEKMGESIAAIATNAQGAASIARQALVAAIDGDKTMDQTVSSIQTIRVSVAETTKKAKRLAESSQEISKIVSIISGISEKTNLLAFNASIEAARAGENGQGFRVVADEVRRLAERVTDSTKEIEQLVSTIQQETTDVLQTMEGSTTQVATGSQMVLKTKQTLQVLAHISQEIDQILQSISTSTFSQAQTSKMVNQTMQAVAAIAQTTSSESGAVVSSLQELVLVAEELQNSVSRFRVEK